MLPSSIDLKRYGVIGVDAKARAGKYRLRKLCPSSARKTVPKFVPICKPYQLRPRAARFAGNPCWVRLWRQFVVVGRKWSYSV
jgi:hypothetical protein